MHPQSSLGHCFLFMFILCEQVQCCCGGVWEEVESPCSTLPGWICQLVLNWKGFNLSSLHVVLDLGTVWAEELEKQLTDGQY